MGCFMAMLLVSSGSVVNAFTPDGKLSVDTEILDNAETIGRVIVCLNSADTSKYPSGYRQIARVARIMRADDGALVLYLDSGKRSKLAWGNGQYDARPDDPKQLAAIQEYVHGASVNVSADDTDGLAI